MLTRRGFAACAICAISGFIAEAADNPPASATTGVKRTILSQVDGPAEGYVTIIAIAEIEAGVQVARHTHPGVESTYVMEGGVEISIDGRPVQAVKFGETFQVPTGMPHSAKSGDVKAKLLINYIIEKGKPIATPV